MNNGNRAGVNTGILLLIYSVLMVVLDTGCSSAGHRQSNYYFDPAAGNDSASGSTPENPFRSLSRLRSLQVGPGDSILLRAGTIFTEELILTCRGDSARPVVVAKYGGPGRPHLQGDGTRMQAVHIFNSENIVVRDLEISNTGNSAVDGLCGILVELKDYGTARNITLDNLYVHDVLGGLVKERKSGGNAIMIRNFEDSDTLSRASRFDGLTVQNCHVRNCQRNGIMMWGNWIRSKWFPSLHVAIRNNLIEGVPGDGIVPVACESPLVEYNIMRDCPGTLPVTEACDGIWPWSCDNALVQFNIVSGHRSKVDGYGFDSDWNSAGSVFQYNLSFNNDGGFILICNPGGWPGDWSIGNRNTRVSFNISINDGVRDFLVEGRKDYFSPVIHMTGDVRNTIIEKNLFVVFSKPSEKTDRTILSLSNWYSYPDSTFFRNNFIHVDEPNRMIDPGCSTNTFFDANSFTGDLRSPAEGFQRYNGKFNRQMWGNENHSEWEILLRFTEGKTVTINGTERSVNEIIGADRQ